MNDLQETLIDIANRMGEMSLNQKEETSPPGKPGKYYLLVEVIMDKSNKVRRKDPHQIIGNANVVKTINHAVRQAKKKITVRPCRYCSRKKNLIERSF